MIHTLNSLRSIGVLFIAGAASLGFSVAQAACQIDPGVYCINQKVVIVYSDCTYDVTGSSCGVARVEEGVPAEKTLEQFLEAAALESQSFAQSFAQSENPKQ